jgi:hypothetical protein
LAVRAVATHLNASISSSIEPPLLLSGANF